MTHTEYAQGASSWETEAEIRGLSLSSGGNDIDATGEKVEAVRIVVDKALEYRHYAAGRAARTSLLTSRC